MLNAVKGTIKRWVYLSSNSNGANGAHFLAGNGEKKVKSGQCWRSRLP